MVDIKRELEGIVAHQFYPRQISSNSMTPPQGLGMSMSVFPNGRSASWSRFDYDVGLRLFRASEYPWDIEEVVKK